jgi:hypothetical protein
MLISGKQYHDLMIRFEPVSDLAASSVPARTAGKGRKLMNLLTTLRDRISAHVSVRSHPAAAAAGRDPNADPSAEAPEAPLPFAGYDRLDSRQVIRGLRDHSQIELEAAECYERSHRDREPVLDKLRYMRGSEPLPGYDALSVEEILAALRGADTGTIKRIRGYERKFAHRPDILDEVVRMHQRRLASQPASTPPAYQPIGATPVKPGGDRSE